MKKVGLVLEGGAMRGMYTVGVLDVLMDENIEVNTIVGTSAGALFGPNYFSGQRSRALRYNKKYCKDLRYMSLLSYLFTGNVINKNFAFYKVTKELDPFDNETFKNSKGEFYATATDVETGLPHYFHITDTFKQLECLRASSAMPLASKMIEIEGKEYLDGGISDGIPYEKCKSLGCDKVIVVLTQPIEYRKRPLEGKKEEKVKRKFRKYPNLVDTMINRYDNYNKTLEKLLELEKKREVFIIRPSRKIDIGLMERNEEKIQSVYDLGVEDTKRVVDNLKSYLTK